MPDKADESIASNEKSQGNPFSQYFEPPTGGSTDSATPAALSQEDVKSNPFSQYFERPTQETQRPSAIEAFASNVVGGILPSAASLAAGAAGAKVGGALGAASGMAVGLGPEDPAAYPLAVVGGGIGAIAGGIGGMIGGQKLVSNVQNWAVSKLPESWQETLGQSEKQKQEYEMEHPTAAWLGAMAPFIATMSPTGSVQKIAETSMTTLGKIMSNPITSRAISGTVMGGFEAGNEILDGDGPDWTKIGIATGLGFIFNKPNEIGERLTGFGHATASKIPGVRTVEGKVDQSRNSYNTSNAEKYDPITVAQANSLNVLGPGVTQEVFAGHEGRNPTAIEAALKDAQVEQQALGSRQITPDIHEAARKLDPGTIEKYDDLQNQRDILKEWVDEHAVGSDEAKWAQSHLDKVDQQLEDLSPARSEVYHRASESIGTDQTSVLPSETREAEKTPEIMEKLSPASRPIEVQRQAISGEIKQNLITAGRPDEEADASARLQAAYYETRAARFNGERGTAEDLYRENAPAIRGAGKELFAPAQKTPESDQVVPAKTAHDNARDVWQEFLDKRKKITIQGSATGGFNKDTGRLGSSTRRTKPSQVWEPGNVVNSGFVKDLLITSKNDDGSFNLIKKPDINGISKAYSWKAQEGLWEADKPVKFDEAIKGITAKNEPALEQRRSKKDEANGYIENLFSEERSVITLAEKANPSTFIHEMAHQWLADLVADAQHPLAPESLKSDLRATLGWMNIKNPEDVKSPIDIKTGNHEKWARGFEQYMREGIAPSPQLADVFSKFKNWLTSVYQTLKGLGRPISPEIKSVFDRMLAEEPRPTTIVPESARGPTLADIHEEDAEHAAPHPEAPEADRIDDEKNRFIQDQPKDIKDEIEKSFSVRVEAAKLARETSYGTAEPSGLEHGGERSKFIPESSISGAANGEINTGGKQNTSEVSGRIPPGSDHRPSNSGKPGISDLAPIARERRDPPPTKLLGKAGNIVLDNITDSTTMAQALQESADYNDQYLNLRKRTPLTEGDALNFSEELGFNESQMKNLYHMSRIVSENIVPAKKLLIEATERWMDARDKWKQTQDPIDAVAYLEARQKQELIQGYFSGVTGNMGRGFGNFKKSKMEFSSRSDVNEFVKKSAGMTLLQLEQEIERSSSVSSIADGNRFIANEAKGKWGDCVHESYIQFLISNPITHKGYAIGNYLLAAYKYLAVKPTAAAIGSIASALGREGEKTRIGETLEFLKQHFNPSNYVAAKDAFKAGTPIELPSETIARKQKLDKDNKIAKSRGDVYAPDFAERPRLNETAKLTDLIPDYVGMMHGIQDSFLSAWDLLKNGRTDTSSPLFTFQRSNMGSIPNINVGGKITIPFGSAIRISGERMVNPIHALFTAFNYNVERNQWAYRTAAEEGLTGTAFHLRTAELSQNPPIEKMQEFKKSAYSDVLLGEAGPIAKSIGKVLDLEVGNSGIKPLRFLVPFNRIQGEIAKKAFIENSILAITSRAARSDILGKNGNIAQDTAIAKIAAGSALTALGMWWAQRKVLTGGGPLDPAERQAWLGAGNMPHSIQIGNFNYDIGKLGPIGKLLSASADFMEMSHAIHDEGLHAGFNHLTHAASRLFLDESPFGAMSNLAKAIEDPGRYGANYATALISNFIPFSSALRQIDRYEDPHMKDAHGVIQDLKKQVPYFSKDVPNRLDVWGEEIPDTDDPHWLIGSGIRRSEINQDPVRQYLSTSGYGVAYPQHQIAGNPIDPDQYREYVGISGRTAHMQLEKIMQGQDWKKMSAEDRHDWIVETVKEARSAASDQLIRKYPALAEEPTRARRWMVRGE